MNKFEIVGRLTKDIETRESVSGTAFTSFALAVPRDFKDKKTGNYETDFFYVTAFRGTAEYLAKYGKKGDFVAVVGTIRIDESKSENGEYTRRYSFLADNVSVIFGARKSGDAGGSNAPQRRHDTEKSDDSVDWSNFDETDDDADLPF